MYKKRQSKKSRDIKKKFNQKTAKTVKRIKSNKNTNKNKRTNKSKKVRVYKKGGMSGIKPIEGLSEDEAFNNFINHSNITFLTKGANGVTFIAELPPGSIHNSSYISTDASTYGQRVKQLIIKFAFLYNDEDEKYWMDDPDDPDNQILDESKINILFSGLKNSVALGLEKDFNREIEIQKDVYLKTMEYLEPICPAVVYSKIEKDSGEIIRILNKFKTNTPVDTKAREIIDSFIQKRGDYDYIGIIGMEYAGGYDILHNLFYSNEVTLANKKLYREMIMYLLLDLAYKAGYTHGDFHGGNLMINPSLNGYFNGIKGKPLLIDFGYAKKIEEPMLSEIKREYDARNYTAALQKICSVNRSDDVAMKDFPSFYGWACGYADPNMDKYEIETEIEDKTNKKINDYKVLTGKRKLKPQELYQLQQQVLEEMADPANARFMPDTNASLNKLFERRKQATDELVVSFKRDHPDGPDLPLSQTEKQEIISSPSSESHSLVVSPQITTKPSHIYFSSSSSSSSSSSLPSSSNSSPFKQIPYGSPEF
jgi:hypothetical protein